jgi:hypothetical protein
LSANLCKACFRLYSARALGYATSLAEDHDVGGLDESGYFLTNFEAKFISTLADDEGHHVIVPNLQLTFAAASPFVTSVIVLGSRLRVLSFTIGIPSCIFYGQQTELECKPGSRVLQV